MSIRKVRIAVNRIPLIIAVIVLVICMLPAIFMNGLFGYFPFIFLLSLMLFSFFYGFILSGKIRSSGKEEPFQCMRNEELILEQRIGNESILPVSNCEACFVTTDLDGRPRSESMAFFTLGSKEQRNLRFRVRFDHVGEYGFYLKELRINGFLGILSFLIPGTGSMKVEVLPKIHTMAAVDLSGNVRTESMEARYRSSAESVDVSGIREYVAGDPIKLIHWKLSSHTGVYVTKTLESYGNNSLTILPGFRLEKDAEKLMNQYDAITECCASLSHLAEEEGIDTSFFIEDRYGQNQIVQSRAGSIPSGVFPVKDSEENLLTRLTEESGKRYSSDNVAVCTSFLDSESSDVMTRMVQSGRNVMLFFIKDSAEDISREEARMFRTLSYFGVRCWTIRSADEIDRVVGI